jgi:hypothetical protein
VMPAQCYRDDIHRRTEVRFALLIVGPAPCSALGCVPLTISCSEKSVESIAGIDLWDRLMFAMSDLALAIFGSSSLNDRP